MLNIVLFGPPGAGKGTQSERLISNYNLIHLSTGDILRSEVAAGTILGLEAKSIMDSGKLVPDEIVIGMINSKLSANANAPGFIFDGFPRTAAQAVALDKLLEEKNTAITVMLALEVSEEELVKRLLNRGAVSGRADDMNQTVIRNRIIEYNNKTYPLKEYYSAQGKYHAINGIGSVDNIFNGLCQVIDNNNTTGIYKTTHHTVPSTDISYSTIEKIEVDIQPATKTEPEIVQITESISVSNHKPAEEAAVIKKPVKKVVGKTKTVSKKAVKKATVKKSVKKVVNKIAAKKAKSKPAKKSVAKKKAPKKAAAKKKVSTARSKQKKTKKIVKKVVGKKKPIAKKKVKAKKAAPKKKASAKAKKVIKKKPASKKKVSKTKKKSKR